MNKTGRNTLIDDLDAWTIIKSILGENDHISMVKHHLESYNDFVKNKIGIIVKQFNPLSIYHSYNEEENNYRYEIMIEFGDVHFNKPLVYENDGSTDTMYPEARLRNLSYSAAASIDMVVTLISNPRSGTDGQCL